MAKAFKHQKLSTHYYRMPLTEQYEVLQKNPALPRYFYFAFDSGCPYPCIFCEIKQPPARHIPVEEAKQFLSSGARDDIKTLIITADEPLMHPGIAGIVAAASTAGFTGIGFSTTGASLDEHLIAGLVSAGLTSIELPIYSHKPEVHDGIVCAAGAHVALMKNILKMKEYKTLKIFTHSLPLKQNLPDLKPLHKMISEELGLPFMIFPVRRKTPRASIPKLGYIDITPKYSDLIGAAAGIPMACFPLCVQKKVLGHTNKIPGELIAPSMKLYILMQGYVKAEKCRDCPLNSDCAGILQEYMAVHGGQEFDAPL